MNVNNKFTFSLLFFFLQILFNLFSSRSIFFQRSRHSITTEEEGEEEGKEGGIHLSNKVISHELFSLFTFSIEFASTFVVFFFLWKERQN